MMKVTMNDDLKDAETISKIIYITFAFLFTYDIDHRTEDIQTSRRRVDAFGSC